MAAEMKVPFLGSIPFDPRLVESGDTGQPFTQLHSDTPAAKAFASIVRAVAVPKPAPAQDPPDEPAEPTQKEQTMRIAIPTANGKLAMHFGHCEQFALIDVDPETKQATATESLDSPPHQPGLLPRWLAEHDVNVIIASGMGQRAQALFTESGIEVVVGAPAETPEALAAAYVDSTLKAGENICDH